MIKEKVINAGGSSFNVSLNDPVARFAGNPILTADDVNSVWTEPALQVSTVHNAGIAICKDETIMLFRSHLRDGRSILGVARSGNGFGGWKIDSAPAMTPAKIEDDFAEGVDKYQLIESESGGIEDPRIVKMDSTYAITYNAYHMHEKNKVRTCLATTDDFKTFTRYGPIMDVDMRNVVLFPQKIGGRYFGLFRPNDTTKDDIGGMYRQILIGSVDDWRSGNWQIDDEPIIISRGGPNVFSDKIGPGAPPIKTQHGWLEIFHGVRATMDGNPYVLGVALHQLDDPKKVKVSNIPILFPSKIDCIVKDSGYVHVPNVVFTCGAIRQDDGTIIIYYGGCDTVMNIGVTHEDVLAELCMRYGQDPKTGEPLYDLCASDYSSDSLASK